MNPCLTGCKRLALYRGLCAGCYAQAARAVRIGRITWAELEKAGVEPLPADLLDRAAD